RHRTYKKTAASEAPFHSPMRLVFLGAPARKTPSNLIGFCDWWRFAKWIFSLLTQSEKHLWAGYGINHDILPADDDRFRRIGVPDGRRNKIGRKLQSEAGGIGRPRQNNICTSGNYCQLRQWQRKTEYCAIAITAARGRRPVQGVAR